MPLKSGFIQRDTFSTESSKGYDSVNPRADSELSIPVLHERFEVCSPLGRLAAESGYNYPRSTSASIAHQGAYMTDQAMYLTVLCSLETERCHA